MGYERALEIAWGRVRASSREKRLSVKLLTDTYDLDLERASVTSRSCGAPAKDYVAIIILHYLAQKSKLGGLPKPSGEWIDFNGLEGGEGYYQAFKKRTIDQILKKFGASQDDLLSAALRLPARKAPVGDAGIVVYPFEEVPVLFAVWRQDEEFGADANILFDKTISQIFCTEDIVVLTEMVTHKL